MTTVAALCLTQSTREQSKTFLPRNRLKPKKQAVPFHARRVHQTILKWFDSGRTSKELQGEGTEVMIYWHRSATATQQ